MILAARICTLLAATCAAAAVAQTIPASAPQQWRSTLDAYRSFQDQPLADWKEANENVARIGGWREYAREASGASPNPPAAPAADRPVPDRSAVPGRTPETTTPRPAGRSTDPHAGHH